MANEINVSASLRVEKGGATTGRSATISVDMAGESFFHNVMSIPTSDTTIESYATSGIDAAETGYLFIKNLDSTNYVEFGLTGSYSIKLLAGEVAVFRAAGAIFGRANTSAVECEILMAEL